MAKVEPAVHKKSFETNHHKIERKLDLSLKCSRATTDLHNCSQQFIIEYLKKKLENQSSLGNEYKFNVREKQQFRKAMELVMELAQADEEKEEAIIEEKTTELPVKIPKTLRIITADESAPLFMGSPRSPLPDLFFSPRSSFHRSFEPDIKKEDELIHDKNGPKV